MTVVIDGSQGVTTPMYGGAIASNAVTPTTAFKNRIINGQMQIDQRNAGASLAIPDSTGTYTLDRWRAYESTDGSLSVQRSSTAPTNFTNSLLVTVTSADSSLGASQQSKIQQMIEGYNVADLAWGTASAKPVTLSFWIRASVTGTYGGCFLNNAVDRSYPFTYTISSANTWTQINIPIVGPTIGTWATNNTTGIQLYLSMGMGTTYSTTAGSWAAGTYYGATGQTNWMNTVGNTFYITGVQLEAGSAASPFENRSYSVEFDMCRRYYERINYTNAGGANQYVGAGVGMSWAANDVRIQLQYYPKRASATCTMSGTIKFANSGSNSGNLTTYYFDNFGTDTGLMYRNDLSGLTTGQALQASAQAANTYVSFSAEL